ncbi:AraC family transcriptional regulator [Actibacterium mucosum KCTC 23349]|uniref:AraC family transcriptional regulator n=1 Tax=Actibacterium mucosum KCTC 23349 TaxID=1454373 RepID=A0A037ZE12_9RHOB|nr:AraC family transcriptional regulator [Actibacterium mucosum]KAJ54357.1 AraC family transcriptional regulator [Actibacterium mucosum KCTC 23349]
MVPENLIQDVFDHVAAQGALDVGCPLGVEGFYAVANQQVTDCTAQIYEPIMVLVLQGSKEAQFGDRMIRYSAGDTLIVSHAVPVEAAVVEASAEMPYVALVLLLDTALLRTLIGEIDSVAQDLEASHALDVDAADMALVDAVARLFQISTDPVEARALAPLVLREIHFRLLRQRHGGMLRQLMELDSPASRISKTLSTIRANYKATIPVADLAAETGMSLSAFHEHFKLVTATTPLQYQKELRLLEARRLLLTGKMSVASTAYEVGYESPTQFSREYSRKFGLSPSSQKPATAQAAR